MSPSTALIALACLLMKFKIFFIGTNFPSQPAPLPDSMVVSKQGSGSDFTMLKSHCFQNDYTEFQYFIDNEFLWPVGAFPAYTMLSRLDKREENVYKSNWCIDNAALYSRIPRIPWHPEHTTDRWAFPSDFCQIYQFWESGVGITVWKTWSDRTWSDSIFLKPDRIELDRIAFFKNLIGSNLIGLHFSKTWSDRIRSGYADVLSKICHKYVKSDITELFSKLPKPVRYNIASVLYTILMILTRLCLSGVHDAFGFINNFPSKESGMTFECCGNRDQEVSNITLELSKDRFCLRPVKLTFCILLHNWRLKK